MKRIHKLYTLLFVILVCSSFYKAGSIMGNYKLTAIPKQIIPCIDTIKTSYLYIFTSTEDGKTEVPVLIGCPEKYYEKNFWEVGKTYFLKGEEINIEKEEVIGNQKNYKEVLFLMDIKKFD